MNKSTKSRKKFLKENADVNTSELDMTDPRIKEFLESVVEEQEKILRLKEVTQSTLEKVVKL